ncbi:MAG: heme exporter protein CcmB [Archaeoglobaceae archaeon]|nr:heme exporter protein CcmB [Archaeoglobaceae archaeon]MDW8127886.1 heme exporter protein CcmB [Archaeoglobaceae archaeon]
MKKLSELFLLFEIIKKDLKIEARSKAGINQMLLLSLTTAFLFSISIDVESFFPQIILLIILFTSISGTSVTILREYDLETLEGLKASPLTNSHIMLAKSFSHLLIVLTITALVYPICYALFNLNGDFLLTYFAVIIAVLPISGAINLLSPLSAGSKGREMLILAMLFPVIFPVLLPATKSIALAYSGTFDLMSSLFIVSYTGIIYSLSILLSDHFF